MLHLLGQPAAVINGTPAPGLPLKAFVVAALLRLERPTMSRSRIAALFWPGAPGSDAARNLRQLLGNVRKWEARTGMRVVNANRSEVWRDDTCIRTDLDELLTITRISDESQLRDVRRLCHGELLEGIEGEAELARWLHDARSRTGKHVAALLASAQAARPAVAAAVLEMRRRFKHTAEFAEVEADFARRAPPAAPRAASGPPPSAIIDSLPRLTIVMPKESLIMPPRGVLLTSSLIDHITIELGRSRHLKVIAPHTAWQLAETDFVAAAGEFQIPFVLELRLLPGSGAETQHHSAKLIDTASREILWSDVFAINADAVHQRLRLVAKAAASQVVDRIENSLLREHAATGDASAYIWELMGRRHMHSLDLRRLRRARNYFRSAIDADRHFAPAWYGAARTLSREWVLCAREDPKLLADARAFAQRAMELDPLDSGGERELGHASLYSGDLAESVAHFAAAEQLAPHDADVLIDLADAQVHNSEIEAAAALVSRALELNPLAPDEYFWVAGSVEFFRRDFGHARHRLKQMKDPAPAARLLAAAAAMDGDALEAERYRAIEMANHPDFRIEDWLKLMPQRDGEHLELYVHALRTAGFPK